MPTAKAGKRKPTALTAALMPVDELADIPPRLEEESQKARKTESPKDSGGMAGLNFKVKAAFRKDFRLFCAEHDLSLVDALAQAFDLLKQSRARK